MSEPISLAKKLITREREILTATQARVASLSAMIKNMPPCTLRNQAKRMLKSKQEAMTLHTKQIKQIEKYAPK